VEARFVAVIIFSDQERKEFSERERKK